MTNDLKNIKSIKDLENFMQDNTHFKNLGLTSENTLKYTTYTAEEGVRLFKKLSNTSFDKKINNLIFIVRHGNEPSLEEDDQDQEQDMASVEEFIEKIINNLNRSSDIKNPKLIFIYDDIDEKGFKIIQNDGVYSIEANKGSICSIIHEASGEIKESLKDSFSIEYSRDIKSDATINIKGAYDANSLYITLGCGSGTTELSNDVIENSLQIIQGDIKTLFEQVGL
jgi:hypothetical protein